MDDGCEFCELDGNGGHAPRCPIVLEAEVARLRGSIVPLRLATLIDHQTQPTPCSCVATCIAMAFDIPVAELGVRLDHSYDFDDFGIWLAERGIWLRPMIRNAGRGEAFLPGHVYIVGVRSLNLVNSDHAVLVDTRGPKKDGPNYNERSGWLTFDPNVGRDGLQTYSWVDENVTLDFCEFVQHDDRYMRAGDPPAAGQTREARIVSLERLRDKLARCNEIALRMGFDHTLDALLSLEAMERGPRPLSGGSDG